MNGGTKLALFLSVTVLVVGGGGGGDGLAARPAMKLLGKSENDPLSQYQNSEIMSLALG